MVQLHLMIEQLNYYVMVQYIVLLNIEYPNENHLYFSELKRLFIYSHEYMIFQFELIRK
jgi:hypothetical protein